jgi:hypothetical protein
MLPIAATKAATPHFMSVEPRPYIFAVDNLARKRIDTPERVSKRNRIDMAGDSPSWKALRSK